MQKVSLILTTYNSEENLRKTLQSIDMQDYAQIEVNIKDGGSTDGTIAIIKNYEKNGRFPLHWISCADKGIYDAMNQGYALAEGEIIVFFNDLFLHPTVVSEMLRLIEENPDCIGAHADLVYMAEGNPEMALDKMLRILTTCKRSTGKLDEMLRNDREWLEEHGVSWEDALLLYNYAVHDFENMIHGISEIFDDKKKKER